MIIPIKKSQVITHPKKSTVIFISIIFFRWNVYNSITGISFYCIIIKYMYYSSFLYKFLFFLFYSSIILWSIIFYSASNNTHHAYKKDFNAKLGVSLQICNISLRSLWINGIGEDIKNIWRNATTESRMKGRESEFLSRVFNLKITLHIIQNANLSIFEFPGSKMPLLKKQ